MASKKTVPVKRHKRSSPSSPAKKTYPKPGPKPVPVKPHKRSPPK